MQNYQNLEVYRITEELTKDIYNLTKKFPREELYNMTQHIRKNVLSVGANIAEGTGRQSDADFLRFLYFSIGSLKELTHFLNIANNLRYITANDYTDFLNKSTCLGKKLSNLIKSIKSNKNEPQATSFNKFNQTSHKQIFIHQLQRYIGENVQRRNRAILFAPRDS